MKGGVTAIVPLYNGETVPKAIRGTMLVMYQMQIITGYAQILGVFYTRTGMTDFHNFYSIFLSYIIDLGTHSIKNSASWRIPVGLQMLWGLILLSGIFFLPESP